MKTPHTFIALRAVSASVTILLLILVGSGFASIGPLHALSRSVDNPMTWFQNTTGIVISR